MKKIIIGISGASGIPIAVRLLRVLKAAPEVETHLILTAGAEITIPLETGLAAEELLQMADIHYENQNIGAAIASGTFDTEGMIVVPCSMKTMAGIANGFSENLLLRACDVTIKEKRKLILGIREAPLSPIHLENMCRLSRLQNVTILPLVLSYYNHPKTLEDMEIHLVGKILSQFGIHPDGFRPWRQE